ncbi:MAG: ATP-grasp domain-containing protein [Flavobacteriaceae bacterium]|nr:ATP-grasp domain-containing protein [Flavobacteriaceae bacterium]
MKKVLILGGSHRDIPLIKASQELGYFVITLGDRDYYFGHEYSDKYYKLNFNDLAKVKEIIESEKIDYLLPGSGEESYLNTVQLAQELNIGNLDNLETAKLVHNKWKFKEFCLKNSISTPFGFYYTDNLNLNNIEFPITVKPTNLSGGRGVEVVYDLKNLKESLLNSKELSSEVFLEEFIDGELIAYSVFIKNQKIIYGFTGKDDTYKNKYLITSAYPIQLKAVTQNRLLSEVEKIARLLSLVDGMFHLQAIIKDKVSYIIDVTRRIPGDFYPYLMEYCDKVEYSKAVVKSYIGKTLKNELVATKKQEFFIRHCVISDKNGLFKEIEIDETLKHRIVFRIDLMKQNTEIKNFENHLIAIIFMNLLTEDKYIINNINELIRPLVV